MCQKIEKEAIESLKLGLRGNYTSSSRVANISIVESAFLQKCAMQFKAQYLSLLKASRCNLDDYSKIICHLSSNTKSSRYILEGKEVNIQNLSKRLPLDDVGKTVYIYRYINKAKKQELHIFFEADAVGRFFCDNKRKLQVGFRAVAEGKNGRIRVITEAHSVDETRLLSLFDHCSPRRAIAQMTPMDESDIPLIHHIENIIDLTDEFKCKLLPYLLTSYTVQQRRSALYNRPNADLSRLLCPNFESDKDDPIINSTRDLKHLEQIAGLFAFPCPDSDLQASDLLPTNSHSEPNAHPLNLNTKNLNERQNVEAIFLLWNNIIQETLYTEEYAKETKLLRESLDLRMNIERLRMHIEGFLGGVDLRAYDKDIEDYQADQSEIRNLLQFEFDLLIVQMRD